MILALTLTSLFSIVACGKRGLESKACVDYFAKTEACAAKAPPIKGDALRQAASVSKQNFEKNLNPMAAWKTC